LNTNQDSSNNSNNDRRPKIAVTTGTGTEAAIKENNSNKRTYKILVVDDERDITSVITKGLKNNGFEVDSYNDPVLALKKFRADVYDILIIDIKMPKMNGFELYKKINEIDNKVKVCFLTAIEYYNDEFRMAFPKLALKCFADKPISIDLLAKIIKQELEEPQ
jgi:two-component system, OmpR family, response regulator ChvI